MEFDSSYMESLPDFMRSFYDNVNKEFEERSSKATKVASFQENIMELVAVLKEAVMTKFGPQMLLVARENPKMVAAGLFLLGVLMSMLVRWFFFRPSTTKSKTDEQTTPNRTKRSMSQTLSPQSIRERSGSEESSRRGVIAEVDVKQGMAISGPKGSSIKFETWTPPISWTDASKHIIPNNVRMKAQVTQVLLELDLDEAKLFIGDAGASVELRDVKLHVQNVTAAVVELFIHDKKTEHTFQSAQAAAQFQQDLLAYQIVGETVMNMYHSLELIHRGSEAHEGKESVLHDSVGDSEITLGAVAWDDAFRCLGSAFPDLRAALEQFTVSPEDEVLASLAPEYQNKRNLLGHVDFFRLFSPLLPSGTQPRDQTSADRLEQFLALRKQVAQAAVYVQCYVEARRVVNKGWKLEWDQDMKRRLAYDDNSDNLRNDADGKCEYYEATVSRDVVCEVHSKQHMDKPGHCVPSAYQGYSLVGAHTFRLPPAGNMHPIGHDRDPIEAIPSLRNIVESNPSLDFFCIGFFPEGPRTAIIQLFVRTLPKGVDPHFDTAVSRFSASSSEVRNRQLDLFIQLGPGGGLSPLTWAAIKAVSVLLSWTRGSDQAQIPVESGGDRTQFPGICLDNYMQMHHFGGSLQEDVSLPANYIAATAHVDSRQMGSVFSALYKRLEDGALAASVVDCSYVLEGREDDELPERVLGTIRLVHCDPGNDALPIQFSAQSHDRVVSRTSTESTIEPPATKSPRSFGLSLFGHRQASEAEETKEEESPLSRAFLLSQDDDGPFQSSIDVLVDILDGVQVPVRRSSLVGYEHHVATELTEDQLALLPAAVQHEDLVNLGVLEKLNRSDLRRYYAATDCNLKVAAVRVVESAAWRGHTFPIDTSTCRVELQSGQFFQQGVDLKGNPVFYFRNMCVGPWRKDPDAVMNAVFHRLETSLQNLSKESKDVKITLVILLGKPYYSKKKKNRKKTERNDDQTRGSSVTGEVDDDDAKEDEYDSGASTSVGGSWNPFKMGINPRLQASEDYHVHTDQPLIRMLMETIMENYPERLYKAIFVPGKSRGYGYWGAALSVQVAIRNNIQHPRTRSKCFVLHRISEIKEIIDPSQLVTIAGGEAPLDEEVFECC